MTDQQKILTIENFVEFAVRRLDINKAPELKFVKDRNWAIDRHSFGQYNPNDNTLTVYINNRNMADVLRTLGHELVHHRQNELGKIKNGSGKTGSDIENEANALAGVLMRDYGRINDTIYEAVIPSLKQIYEAEKSGRIQIYCDMDGVLCDFDSRFEHYYGVSPREYANEKGQKAMEEAVDKVGVVYWSKMPWLAGGEQLWNKISKYNPKILTSPGKFIHAREGKLIWIKENLNPQPQDIMFANTGKKFEAIKDKTPQEIRSSMLIDDYYPNLAPWKEIGGIAIMYKSYDQVSAILDKFRLTEDKLSYNIISSEQFNKIYVEDRLKKAYFGNKYKKNIVTDIEQYGKGDYWCVSENCIEHYRENPNYIDEDETILPTGLKIAVGNQDTFDKYEKEIKLKADGFYDPQFDTYGLVLFKKYK